jgi:phosphonatase-like hydrolase
MKFAIDLVVFDMVGTTVEDNGQVQDAFVDVLDASGIAVSLAEIAPWRGAPKRDALGFFLQKVSRRDDAGFEARLDGLHARFRERLEEQYRSGGTKAIPGAESTFVWLRDHGIKIALTTGFYRQLADTILSALGWSTEILDTTVSSDEVAMGRPAPHLIFRAMERTDVDAVRRVAKIGDTVRDLKAGMNAGASGVIGVLSGSHGLDTLGQTAHTHIISSVAVLPGLIADQFAA